MDQTEKNSDNEKVEFHFTIIKRYSSQLRFYKLTIHRLDF